jgi:tRNA dimethylallyltransferase
MWKVSEGKGKLLIILGPTASGKTDLAIRLAEKLDGAIINADSMQVYRGMDIGTAKPTIEQRRLVPHYLIDIADPHMNFTASDFRREAAGAIADIVRRGKRAIMAGGTGLYIKTLLKGLVDSPRGGGEVRRELEARSRSVGNEGMLKELSRVDPETAATLHPNNLVRIIRALEVFIQTGIPISKLRSSHGFAEEHYETMKVGLSVDRGELYQRIERRVDRMIEEGLVDEVRSLLQRGFTPDMKAMRSIGYRQICGYLAGEFTFDEAVNMIKRDSRRYAKRQLTWFNSDKEIYWVEYSKSFASIYKHVIDFFA